MSAESQAATTTLHVVIGGLCLLVRDEKRSDGKKMLHVLMPDHGHAVHHTAVLMHDPIYGCSTSGPICQVPLDGVLFNFPEIGGSITTPIELKKVVNEKCVGGQPVERKFLDGTKLHGLLKSRITIASGREGTETNIGGLWELGGCTQHMATLIHWEIPGFPSGDLELDYTLNGQDKSLKLRPRNNAIELFFLHEMPESLPSSPPSLSNLPPANEPTEEEAVHFRALYPLLRKQLTDKAPKYKGGNLGTRSEEYEKEVPASRRGFDFQCIAATAPAEPKP